MPLRTVFVDHPRACGEHRVAPAGRQGGEGSSPRLRGTQSERHRRRRGLGIIPALAGNTTHPNRATRAKWDHPRACGEHVMNTATDPLVVGSSPRLRGTHRGGRRSVVPTGITPALAGNTRCRPTRSRRAGDHPRACGEHRSSMSLHPAAVGSSPRLRGTRHRCGRQCQRPGIIPALAGNTRNAMAGTAVCWDHPRACGEHAIEVEPGTYVVGSSPRLRGTPGAWVCAAPFVGIIPALAGNTGRYVWWRFEAGDHPRACGEHVRKAKDAIGSWGSSPRLRGTQRV